MLNGMTTALCGHSTEVGDRTGNEGKPQDTALPRRSIVMITREIREGGGRSRICNGAKGRGAKLRALASSPMSHPLSGNLHHVPGRLCAARIKLSNFVLLGSQALAQTPAQNQSRAPRSPPCDGASSGPLRDGHSIALAGSDARPQEFWLGTAAGGVLKSTASPKRRSPTSSSAVEARRPPPAMRALRGVIAARLRGCPRQNKSDAA